MNVVTGPPSPIPDLGLFCACRVETEQFTDAYLRELGRERFRVAGESSVLNFLAGKNRSLLVTISVARIR